MRNIIIPIFTLSLFAFGSTEANLPSLTPKVVNEKVAEIMQAHASHKELSPELVKRILVNYLELLDPNKTYFIASDIKQWTDPSQSQLIEIQKQFENQNFIVFETIHNQMVDAINRRHQLDSKVDPSTLTHKVSPSEFKDLKWAKSQDELIERLEKIRSLQLETATKLNGELKDISLQRIQKRQSKFEGDLLTKDPEEKQNLILSNLLKATASALDTHTSYFTPDEATQFLISVQQRLFGIGAQLRDDLNGFTVVKIVDGGPAAASGLLKVKDRIIAVNGEPVVGMDINDAVQLIRGAEETPVRLTIIREEGEGEKTEEKRLNVTLKRGEVVLKETRYDSNYEPFGDGVIAYLRLHSFYQDPEHSSAADLAAEINKLKEEHKINGLILDLRNNSGGMLSQAVSVTGLFITKGVVVSIKDSAGNVQHLRDLDGKVTYDGPLIVLVNRASASASEIVAQTLQDYGRALIVGDDHTYGKGSFQTFTLNPSAGNEVNPQGEYKVTRGRYYTVSGKTPQLIGVLSDIVVQSPLSEIEIGERYTKYPLENDTIKENFDDDLADIPFLQREKIRLLYKFNLQPKLTTYEPVKENLRKNSNLRLSRDMNYQNFLKDLKKKDDQELTIEESFGQNDLQLTETYNIMKDLVIILEEPQKQRRFAA